MKIICIGINYKDHAKEMGKPVPDAPIFFLKPDSALLPKRNPFFIPDFSKEVHYEVELIFKIKKVGKSIDAKFSNNYYEEVGLGIDLLQEIFSKNVGKGHPWEIAKAFDQSALVGEEFLKINSKENINFSLHKNGEVVQKSSSDNMIFDIDEIISYVYKFMTLKIGDLIFTGTPSGVGSISIGDTLEGFINEKKIFKVNIK